MGEPFTYTLEARFSEGWEALPGELRFDPGPFEIRERSPMEKVQDKKGGRAVLFNFILAGFEVGEGEIPAASIVFRGPGGKEAPEESNAVRVTVVPTAPEEATDLRDIKDPVEAPLSWKKYLLGALAALLLLTALFFLARFLWRKRRSGADEEAPPAPGPPPRPAHEVALEELAKLEGMNLIKKGRIKLFHIKLSEIVREFIGARYGFGAPEMTTAEIEAALDALQTERYLTDYILGFLGRCDLVKFAKHRPPEMDLSGMLPMAYKIVETARPREGGEPATPRKNGGPREPENASGGEARS